MRVPSVRPSLNGLQAAAAHARGCLPKTMGQRRHAESFREMIGRRRAVTIDALPLCPPNQKLTGTPSRADRVAVGAPAWKAASGRNASRRLLSATTRNSLAGELIRHGDSSRMRLIGTALPLERMASLRIHLPACSVPVFYSRASMHCRTPSTSRLLPGRGTCQSCTNCPGRRI